MEEILKRPAARQMNVDATSCFADARANLEQLDAHHVDDIQVVGEFLRRTARQGH